MPSARTPSRLGAALTGAAVTALLALTAAPAHAADEPVTIDVLKVVDGEYVVETVAVPAGSADRTEASLEARADVVEASPSVTYRPQGTDPFWEADDPQQASAVRDVWTRTRGAGQTVAVLDTGVDPGHPDLAGALVPGTDTVGGPLDPWHGTGVAGVIAARADNGTGSAGMAPEARIMPVRVCNATDGCPSAAIARGILWAVDHGADVVNMSLSGAGWSDVTAVAIRYALDHDVVLVASTGNDGLNGNPVMYPAANEGVIAVSATTPAGAPADWAVHGWQADVATVGESVLLTMPGGGFASGSGTSFSGPAVAGAVALLRAAHPGITPGEVQAALQAGADASGSWDRAWGAGRLVVPAALAAADRTGAAPTVTPAPGAVDVAWAPVAGAPSYTVRVDGVVRATVSGTTARVSGLTDGTQVAVDVQPAGGERSRPVLATVGPAAPTTPVLHSAALRGTASGAALDLTASVPGASAPRLAIYRDGVGIGTITRALTGTPETFSIGIGAMPTQETRWQLRGVDDLGRQTGFSNAVVVGSGRPAVPGAVTGLTGRADGDQVLLSWDDAGTAYTYRVAVGGELVADPRTAGVTLPAPAVGVSRTYDVAVVDAWGQAGPATAVTVTPTGATRPGAPTGVTTRAGDGRVTVSWSPAADNGSPVTGYTVLVSPGGATVTTTGATTATVTGLANGSGYAFTVTATNAVGTGPASEPAYGSPAAVTVPGAPAWVSATPGNGQASVTWAAAASGGSPVTGYTVRASPGGATVTTAGVTTAMVTGLTNGTAYTFTVTATNAAGTGPASAPSAAVTPVGGGADAIAAAYSATGGSSGPLGARVGSAYATAGGGLTQAYQNGRIHWSPSTGAHAVFGDISRAYDPLWGESGVLGYPVGDRYATPGNGWTQAFQFGRIHTSPGTGAHAVYGDISRAYDPLWGESGVLGYPVGDRYATPGNGWTQAFQLGRIHTSPATGAHAVFGDISKAYDPLRGESGVLGYPVGDRYATPGNGWTQAFQLGRIHTSPSTGAHAVFGDISRAYDPLWGESGVLGYPVGDRYPTPGNGWTQAFQFGRIHTSPGTGAHAVYGDISRAYDPLWGESGVLGYPVGDRYPTPGNGWTQAFQFGRIHTSPATGAYAVLQPISPVYDSHRGESGPLGYPLGNAVAAPDGTVTQTFQRGRITVRGGQVTVGLG
ncbi:S8 family serine peptidase [Geodermatophilus sp. SYSU D00684]